MDFKKDFPIFNNKPSWVYLDTAATSLKPYVLGEKLNKFYNQDYATINRAVYKESLKATQEYHETRELLAEIFHADSEEFVFTKGTTEGLNLLAYSLGENLIEGDAILLSEAEHHSNIVPWQLLAKRKNLHLKFFKINDDGNFDDQSIDQLLTPDVKIISCCHISNVIGLQNPIEQLIKQAQEKNIITIIDGAQAAFNLPINLKQLGCDFYVFSAHKCYGPTGLGVLYGKKERLNQLPPFISGGDMIQTVSYAASTFQLPPLKFEAGTPNIADVIAFGAVLKYLKALPWQQIILHKQKLMHLLLEGFKDLSRVQLIAENPNKIALQSFIIDGIHPLDLALYLDAKNIAIRTGHLCAMPLLEKLKLSHVSRVSLGLYTDENDLAQFFDALKASIKLF
jgi:cysteine desulfurase/selenocysteine lyase